ncbi:MAG: prepilin-type N-terminal cleavage/methylation domain-containing protein [Phycisphaerae bacterium]|jgi:prepilin-type N-terminal cleavage/methylation domain-containing protein
MHVRPGLPCRRSGFTLVELLTVIGIIALLIGILVPSLARARDVAKATKTNAELSAIEKALEIFENDFKGYPASDSTRDDPIVSGMPNAVNGNNIRLQGAHWLARALCGPDTLGLDTGGLLLRDRTQVTTDSSNKLAAANGGASGVDFSAVYNSDRKGSYLDDNRVLVKDTDTSKFSNVATQAPRSPNSRGGTGRFVIVDAFNWPILYYRANPKATAPFWTPRNTNHQRGVYNLSDNEQITGSSEGNIEPWDFASTGFKHGLGHFGPAQTQYATNPDAVETPPPADYKGKNFADYLHEHRAHDAGSVIKPVKPETFVLISPGKDGLYGTNDDVNNFNR